ncbi:MAG: OmpH family outer membrane protein [Candidatus Omnitrophica bacterium]|nr:OmpH family outer membrane protein [Candidatus Omnitrophota bacterium]
MTKIALNLIVISGLLLSPLVTQPLPASAAESAAKLAVIDLDRILEGYRGTESSDKRLEKLSEDKKGQREKFVSEIKEMREELILLNEEARLERQKLIEEKLKGLAAFDREARTTLVKKREEEMKTIFDEIEAVVASFAKEQGFTLVVSHRAVLYRQEGMDVTDQVLKILNDHYGEKKRSS